MIKGLQPCIGRRWETAPVWQSTIVRNLGVAQIKQGGEDSGRPGHNRRQPALAAAGLRIRYGRKPRAVDL